MEKRAVCICDEQRVRFELPDNSYDMLFKYIDLKNTVITKIAENTVSYEHCGAEYGMKLSCEVMAEENGYRILPNANSLELKLLRFR